MQIEPSAGAFAKIYGQGAAQVVWTTLVADLETPVSAFLKVAGGRLDLHESANFRNCCCWY